MTQDERNTRSKPAGSAFRRYLGNSAWILGDSVVNSAFGFLVLTFVARVLGAEDYGSYAYVFSLAQIFAMLGHAGLEGLLTRELVDKPNEHDKVLGTAGGLRAVGYIVGASFCLTYGMAMPGHTPDERWLFVSASLFILMAPGPMLLENWFRARLEANYPAMARIAGSLLGGAAKISLVLGGAGVVWIGFAQAGAMALTFAFILVAFVVRGGPLPHNWRFEGSRARAMLSESWMAFVGAIFAVIYLRIDQVMLRWWEGTEAVGIYAIAARLTEVSFFLPSALVISLFPRMIQLRKEAPQLFDGRLQSLFHVLALLSYAVIALIAASVPFLLVPVFGTDYAEAVPVVLVLMSATPFIFMRFAFSRWLLIERFIVFSVICQGVGAVSNVALNMMLIPQYGMTGAALATVVSYAIAGYLALLCSARTRPVFFMMSKALLQPWKSLAAIQAMRRGIAK